MATKIRHSHIISVWLLAIRAITFPLSALPVIVAVTATVALSEIQWIAFLVTILAVIMLHASGNLFNEYFDFKYHVDKPAAESGRFCGVLPGELLGPSQVLIAAVIFALASGAMALWLVRIGGPLALLCGAVGIFGLYAYTGPPFVLKYRGVGEPLIFIVYGPALMLGAASVQTGQLEPDALFASVPVGLLITDVLLVNNIRDYKEDKEAGITTLPGLIGIKPAKNLYIALIILANLSLCIFYTIGLFTYGVLLPLASVFLAIPLFKRLHKGNSLGDMDTMTARYTTVFCLLLAVGLVLL